MIKSVVDEIPAKFFHCFNDWNRLLFWYSKKSKSLGSSDDRADQIAGRNDDITLGILRANLELKDMFIICS